MTGTDSRSGRQLTRVNNPPGTGVQRRNTRQREIILEVIRSANGPLSIHQILTRSRQRMPRLGLATVYRTVNLLREEDRIELVTLPGEEPRFEPAHRGHHHHFRCRVCNDVFELEACPVHLPVGMVLAGGFVVQDHHLTLYGVCPDCATKNTLQ